MQRKDTALKYFDAIFLINLDRRPDRLEKAKKELFKYNINDFYRYPAIDGKDIDYRGPLNAGQLGCTLSHLGIIKYAKAKKLEKIFVFEDDIKMSMEFNDIISKAIEELPEDWCLFYAGINHNVPPIPFSKHLVKVSKAYCNHAYAIHSRYYDIIINLIEKNYNQVIDDYYAVHINSRYPCFSTIPKIAFQARDYSDLQYKIVDYSGMLKN